MDRVYRYQRYIYDFTRKYYLFGRDRLIRDLVLQPGESLVEIGCGTARNLVQIARLYPGNDLFGLDASAEMLKTAAAAVARAGLSDRITLAQGYAEAFTPATFGRAADFDHVVFSYSLSMIPDWYQALRAASRAVSDSGQVHIVDFGDLSGLSPAVAEALRAWLGLFHVSPRTEILQNLEVMAPEMLGSRRNLHILPARYAFILSLRGKYLRGLTG